MSRYLWKCSVCGDATEVVRKPSTYDVPPDEETEVHAGCITEQGHKWERQIQGGQFVEGLGNKGKH